MSRAGNYSDKGNAVMSGQVLLIRFILLAFISIIAGLLTHFGWGLNPQQTISVTAFLIFIPG